MSIESGRVVPCVLGLALLAGCGLPSYRALYAPVLERRPTSVEAGLEFVYGVPTTNNSSIFEGVELYYKLYTGAEVDDGEVERDTQAIVDRLGLEREGFFRMLRSGTSATDTVRPLLNLTNAEKADEELELIVDFSPLITDTPSDFPRFLIGAEEFPLARNVSGVVGTISKKGFSSDEFASTDRDVPATYDAEADTRNSELYVAVCLLAYGNDIAALEFNIFSGPTFGGYIAVPGQ